MRRSKLGSAESRQGSRPAIDPEQSEAEDPIAAAAQAKQARAEARIKAAAEAAAKAFAGKSKTVFFDISAGQQSPEGAKAEPASVQSGSAASTNGESASNPLASILGYDHDDSASEDGSEPPSPREPVASSALSSPNGEQDSADTPAQRDSGEEVDPMLASFMSELESSGLLSRDDPQPGSPEPSAAAVKPEASSLETSVAKSQQADGQDGSEPNLAAAIVDAVTSDTDGVSQQQGTAEAPEPEAIDSVTEEGGEAAEQRVLGDLDGAPSWREVMDMASGKVYFWDSESNEVAWEPPPGTKPRSTQDNAATFASAQQPDAVSADATTTDAAESEANADAPTSISQAAHVEQDHQDTSMQQASEEQATVDHDQGGSSEEREDGQLAQAETPAAAPTAAAAPAAGSPAAPDASIAVTGQQVCDELRTSTQGLCHNIPQLVRLAIEAEIRMQDWHMFCTRQQRAVEAADAQQALSWTDFQDHMQWRWQSIQAAMPAAISEAEMLHQHMQQQQQQVEEGEMPPLPSDDSSLQAGLQSRHGQAVLDGQPALPTDSADASADTQPALPMDSVTASAEAQPALPADDAAAVSTRPDSPTEAAPSAADPAVDPSAADTAEAPPLPLDDPIPSSAAPPTDQATSSGAADKIRAAAEAGAAAEEEVDMEVDTDAESRGSPAGTASRPASADAAARVSGPSSGLPDWAGYYMTHGYTYPYYGQATAACTLQPSTAQATSSAPSTSQAAEFLSTRLAKDPSANPSPNPTAGPQPAPQPAAVKKKQYRAEPAPAPAVPADLAADAGDALPSVIAAASTTALPAADSHEAEARKRKRPKAPVGLGQLAAKKKKGTKGVGGLIDKWAAVRKNMEEEAAKAEEEQFPDAAVVERKRAEEAEKWRLQQLKAGASSDDNANFQPLAVDWREKMKANRKSSSGKKTTVSPEPASTSPEPKQPSADSAEVQVTADGKPDLALLSKGLPQGWRAMWDKNTGDIYYGNLKTRYQQRDIVCWVDQLLETGVRGKKISRRRYVSMIFRMRRPLGTGLDSAFSMADSNR